MNARAKPTATSRDPKWRALQSLVVVFTLVFAACSGGSSAQREQVISALIAQASEFQRPLVADGVVEFAEYEQAIFAEYACIKDRAPFVEIDGPRIDPDSGEVEVSIIVMGDESSAAVAEAAMEDCRNEYSSVVASIWAEQLVPTEKEREMLLAELRACLSAAGIDAPSSESDLAAIDDPGAAECFQKYSRAFLVPRPLSEVP